MTRDEVQAVIYHLIAMGDTRAADAAGTGGHARVLGQAQGIAEAARTLEAALNKSEADRGMSTPEAEMCGECGAWVCRGHKEPT